MTGDELVDAGSELLAEYGRTRSQAYLDDSISVLRRARGAVPATRAPGVRARTNLGVALRMRHDARGAAADIDEAIEVVREAVAVLSSQDRQRATLLSNLTVFLITRAGRWPDHARADRDAGVVTYARAVRATVIDHPDLTSLGGMQQRLGGVLMPSVEQENLPDLPDDAVSELRETAAGVAPGHPARPALLGLLASARWSAALRCDDERGLDDAVGLYREALAAAPAGRADRAVIVGRLAWLLGLLHDRTGHPVRLDEAIAAYREDVVVPDRDPRALADSCARLARWAERHAELHGDIASLDEADGALGRALAAASADQPDRAKWTADRGRLRRLAAARRGDVDGLRAAVALGREAVGLTAPDDPYLPGRRAGLAVTLSVLFEHTSDRRDLAEGIEGHRRALADLPADHPERPGFLANLGGALQQWADETADTAALDEAVTVLRSAAAALSPGHPATAEVRGNLAEALRRRGDAGARDEAREADEAALATSPPGHPKRAATLANLASGLTATATDAGDVARLDRAIALHTEAVAATDPDDLEHAGRSAALARAWEARFDLVGDSAALDRAITAHRAAVASTPPTHAMRARRLNELGIVLQEAAEHEGDRALLAEAVQTGRDAVDAAPPGHPERATNLINLGNALQRKVGRDRDEAAMREAAEVLREAVVAARRELDAAGARVNLANVLRLLPGASPAELDEARDLLRAAGRSPRLPPRVRLLAASDRADLAADAGDFSDAVDGYLLAVDVVGEVASSALGRGDLERGLRAGAGLAADAAACLERMGADPAEALAALERGRGAMLAHGLDERAAEAGVELGPAPGEGAVVTGVDGPVVTVAVSRHGSHAFVVVAGGVRSVPLPDLTPDAVRERVAVLLAAVDAPVGDPWADTVVGELLAWLWDSLAEPVLSDLGIDGPPPAGRPAPRLWWIPTGPLSLLPLHAAGRHLEGSGATVLDRVVPSTVPTITALRHAARSASPCRAPDAGRMTVVAMPRTPDMPDLPGARPEAALLAEKFAGVRTLVGARRDEVLEVLSDSAWLHVAGHATTDLVRSSRSGLVLADERLSVADLAAVRVRGGHLAFLSACSTAGVDIRLADESISVASAFRLAGFPHVIATLWPVDDGTAVAVAAATYDEPAEEGPARALRHAVLARRDMLGGHHPVRWAAYLHSGP